MAVERRLTEIVGPLGGKLHTGRSRNDQVATDLALFVRDHAGRARRSWSRALMARLLELAEATPTGRCPATRTCSARSRSTSATTCSPTSGCSSATARRFAAAARVDDGDAARLRGARRAQLGPRPRRRRAPSSASTRPSPNSIDARLQPRLRSRLPVRGLVCATHLSRLGGELVIWSSQEFGFCEPADDFASGSSIMPQKKNPDAAELLRAKAPRVSSSAADAARRPARAAARLRQGPPGGQGGAVRRRRHDRARASRRPSGCSPGLRFDRERLAEAAADEMLAATDIADLLVRKGMPFREAHGVVGESGPRRDRVGPHALGAAAATSLPRAPSCSTTSTTRCSPSGAWLDSKVSRGGTGFGAARRTARGRPRGLVETLRPASGVG